MRRQRPLALLAVLAACGGLSACGSDEELSTQVPATSPDLTIPTGTTEAPSDDAATTTQTTTATTAAPATEQPAAPPGAPTPPAAPPPPPPATGSPQTGGQAPQTGQSTTGGTQAGGSEFDDFCAENPGVDC